MHPELKVWVDLYLISVAYEYQDYQFFKDAGARGTDFEIFAHLKVIHQQWQKEAAKGNVMAR